MCDGHDIADAGGLDCSTVSSLGCCGSEIVDGSKRKWGEICMLRGLKLGLTRKEEVKSFSL